MGTSDLIRFAEELAHQRRGARHAGARAAGRGSRRGESDKAAPIMALNGERKPLPASRDKCDEWDFRERQPLPQSDCQDEHPPGGISHDPGSKIAARFGSAQSDFGRRLVPRHMPPVDPAAEEGGMA